MRRIAAAIAASALLAGCRSMFMSPYDYMENWLIREDAVRPFSISADLIYVQGRLYKDMASVPAMTSYAKSEVGERFKGVARVFSPLVASADDLENAVNWYLRHHHTDDRPFAFIGEGEGGALLKAYEEENADSLRRKGLVMSMYTEKSGEGFASDLMVYKLKNAVSRKRYQSQWYRVMPEGMLKEEPPSSLKSALQEDTIKR